MTGPRPGVAADGWPPFGVLGDGDAGGRVPLSMPFTGPTAEVDVAAGGVRWAGGTSLRDPIASTFGLGIARQVSGASVLGEPLVGVEDSLGRGIGALEALARDEPGGRTDGD
jgi:hypothetical protein